MKKIFLIGTAVLGMFFMTTSCLDNTEPAGIEAMRQAKEEGLKTAEILLKGTQAAEAGVEYTKTIIATKGRASYLGERSIGHQDPGATSFTDMLDTVRLCVSR